MLLLIISTLCPVNIMLTIVFSIYTESTAVLLGFLLLQQILKKR